MSASRYNTSALNNSPYVLASTKTGARVVSKYLLNGQEEATVSLATAALQQFLTDNPTLRATFSTTTERLKGKISNHPYMVINGTSISLTKERDMPGEIRYKDRYFSELLLKQPVKCPQGHIFEQKRAQYWARHANGLCPVGGNHPIGPLQVDADLQEEVTEHGTKIKQDHEIKRQLLLLSETNTRLEKKVKKLEGDKATLGQKLEIQKQGEEKKIEQLAKAQEIQRLHNASLEHNQNALQQQMDFIRGIRINPWTIGGSFGKLLIKAGGKQIVLSLAKLFAKKGAEEAAKATGKIIAKQIPFVSLAIGILAAFYRYTQGQYYRAVAELVSGGIACIPVYGTGISIGLDVCIVLYDLYEAYKAREAEFTPTVLMDLNLAYRTLEFDPKDGPSLSQKQIYSRYKKLAAQYHPNKASSADLEDYNKELFGQIFALVNLSWEEIQKQRGWLPEKAENNNQSLLLEDSQLSSFSNSESSSESFSDSLIESSSDESTDSQSLR